MHQFGGGKAPGQQANGGAFHIAFNAGYLSGETNVGAVFERQVARQQGGAVQKRVAVQTTKARKTRLFKPRNKAEHIRLTGIFQLGLKPDHIEQRAKRIVLAQLHNGVRLDIRLVGIGQPARFHRPMAQRFAPARGHHLNRQTAIEIGRVGFPFFEIGGFAVEQRVDEAVILGFVHWAVDIVFARTARAQLVVARLVPADIHINAVVIDYRCNRVEKGQPVLARHASNGLRQRRRGQRAGGNNRAGPICGNVGNFLAPNFNIGMGFQRGGHGLGKALAVNRQCGARRNLVFVSAFHNQAVGVAQFCV